MKPLTHVILILSSLTTLTAAASIQTQTTSSSTRKPDFDSRFETRLVSTHYEYTEPKVMQIEGWLAGIDMDLRLTHANVFNQKMFWAINGEYLTGSPNYDGRRVDNSPLKTSSSDNITTLTTSAGYRHKPASARVLVDMSLGFGYRYLENKINDGYAYLRQQEYFYSPITTQLTFRLSSTQAFKTTIEYDHFWRGQNTTHLSQVDNTLPDLELSQNTGHGFKFSLGWLTKLDLGVLLTDLFYREWSIGRSDLQKYTEDGETVIGYEPKNKTQMLGASLGFRF